MKILVDPASSYNLGDTAMLEGAVCRLTHIMPDVEMFIIERPRLKTMLWRFPRVTKQREYRVRSVVGNMLESAPFLWRYHNNWQRFVFNIALSCLGIFFRAESLSVSSKINAESKTLKEICKLFDALFIVGGGNLTDTFYASLFQKCCLMQAFVEQGKPVILTGQQIGPFASRLWKKNLSKILQKVDFIGLRECGGSLTFCKEAQIKPDRFVLMGDDSFGMTLADESSVTNFLAENGLRANEFLSVNFRIAPYSKENMRYLDKMAAVIDKLAHKFKMPILVVPIAFNISDSDIAAGKRINDLVKHADIRMFRHPHPTSGLIKGILGKAFGAFGVSYHFCTFALSSGIPAICTYSGRYYGQKARGLCLFWEDERLAVSLEKLNVDSIAEHIEYVLKDGSLRGKLRLQSLQKKIRWQEIFDNQIKGIFTGDTLNKN
ncbi:MAG: polysaccharide pyruvyl transferase family protein [Candidatus Omnitrophica bacterium]|nr:polysaccharide pyruvyl transferase family protein [Candidatus Omnitrophota bacterium]